MRSRKLQKSLSQLRYVMHKIEISAASKGLLQRTLTVEEAAKVFMDSSDSVAVSDFTEHSRSGDVGSSVGQQSGSCCEKNPKQQ
jgi:hypothetical protein